MLTGALAIFTLVAVMGLVMLRDAWKGYAIDPAYPILHAAAALAGSALVIVAALQGDTRVYVNIGMAVVIILLGLAMGLASKKGKRVPKGILVAHMGLAVACYGLLGFYALNIQ
ncbi:MAG: uncharacterized protein H6R26_323 [Proteobacteria bacterium]|nr:uncharacterized protein [Pseudomonadota bacterium]